MDEWKYAEWTKRNEILRKEFEPQFKSLEKQLKELSDEYHKRSHEIYKDIFKEH
jgi:hypothetical protein